MAVVNFITPQVCTDMDNHVVHPDGSRVTFEAFEVLVAKIAKRTKRLEQTVYRLIQERYPQHKIVRVHNPDDGGVIHTRCPVCNRPIILPGETPTYESWVPAGDMVGCSTHIEVIYWLEEDLLLVMKRTPGEKPEDASRTRSAMLEL